MQAASFTGVLNIILVIMLFYYGIKFIGRFLVPIFFQKVMKKAEEKFRQQQGYQENNITKEGETTIDKKPTEGTKGSNSVGEYIDYEEIDD
jgi:hypothetical protein